MGRPDSRPQGCLRERLAEDCTQLTLTQGLAQGGSSSSRQGFAKRVRQSALNGLSGLAPGQCAGQAGAQLAPQESAFTNTVPRMPWGKALAIVAPKTSLDRAWFRAALTSPWEKALASKARRSSWDPSTAASSAHKEASWEAANSSWLGGGALVVDSWAQAACYPQESALRGVASRGQQRHQHVLGLSGPLAQAQGGLALHVAVGWELAQ